MKSVKIYKFDHYKEYIRALIESSPNHGRGQYRKLSKHLNVHSTLISQILSGTKDFSMEQAFNVCSYFDLNKMEKDYFILLVQIEKSGSVDLKDYYNEKLEKIKNKFQKISIRIKAKKNLDDNQIATYYSDWHYVAIWLASSINNLNTIESISTKFNLDPLKVSRITDFLIQCGLCTEKNGVIKMGQTRTHLDSTSPLAKRHHTNWRIKAIENFENVNAEELAFSAPLSISKKDFKSLKSEILDFIEVVSKKVKNTNPEEIACLNIDLFKI